jgi:hypothetical protein
MPARKSYCGFSKFYSRARSNFTSTSRAGAGRFTSGERASTGQRFVCAAGWEAFERVMWWIPSRTNSACVLGDFPSRFAL